MFAQFPRNEKGKRYNNQFIFAIFIAAVFKKSVLLTFHIFSSFAKSLMAKGFGNVDERKEKSAGQKEREQASKRYDEISQSGGQEYSIFVRQFGSADDSWLPCGSIAVARGDQVSNAIFSN